MCPVADLLAEIDTLSAALPNTLRIDMSGDQTTTSLAAPNLHAVNADPVLNSQSNGGKCPVETTPAGPGVATYESLPLPSEATAPAVRPDRSDSTCTSTGPGGTGA